MKNVKIFVECNALVADHFSGVGHYVKEITQALDNYIGSSAHKNLEIKKQAHYSTTLFTSKERFKKLSKFGFKNFRTKIKSIPSWVPQKLINAGFDPPIDIWLDSGTYLFTNFTKYPLLRSKCATIIYDISFEIVPQFVDANNARYLSKIVRKAVNESDLVITISEYTKNELVNYYNLDPKKVLVAYPAVDKKVFYKRDNQEIAKVRDTYKLPENYILFVGNIEPRKNVSLLIDAYTKLPSTITSKLPLLLVGADGWLNDEIFEKIKNAKANGFSIVRPKSYVEDKDMPSIYSGASLFIYPTHYEGFGIPPLEAMSCGVPVITANNTSLPEVIGDAGVLINTNDESALVDAIKSLTNDQSLRSKLIENGYQQVLQFSWDKSARTIYKSLIEL